FFNSSGYHRDIHSFPTRRSSDLVNPDAVTGPVRPLAQIRRTPISLATITALRDSTRAYLSRNGFAPPERDQEKASAQLAQPRRRSEEHTSELQSLRHLVCRLLLE